MTTKQPRAEENPKKKSIFRELMHKGDDGMVLGIFDKGEGMLYCCKCEKEVELKDTYVRETEIL